MKMIMVRYEDYDCHTVGVAHPIEVQSKEDVIVEFNKNKIWWRNRLKEQYPNKEDEWRRRYASFEICGLFVTVDFLSDGLGTDPEFYTFEEWFYKYQEIDKREEKKPNYS